ncbi:SDR family NAD(P)-dependent oxidoreductase [Micromonosporaceae bacterium Da 78-11]
MTAYARPDALAGRTAIVTGAGQGIGRGIAEALAERGASLLLTDVADKVTAIAEELGGRAVVADLRDADAPERIVQGALTAFGRIDILVNNAVALRPGAFHEQDDEAYDLVFDTGPKATFRLMRAAFPHLVAAGGGSVINFGSSAGTEGEPGFATYGGAKEAIRGLSKTAALEWAALGIRVNVISPFANSDGMRLWEQTDPESYGAAVAKVPMQRIGDVKDDIGAMVAFLAGDESSYLTGQTLRVDGGRSGMR